ncbi:MAG: iron-sulfur cluster assembly scaffold protein [Candidatus Gracilibacteria bacterium]|jgi:nitrogen fixation NifU-like protein|nr:iron-sulfur cluster assembly scaffold protein [Candidatus Gracilibacteria bacterium]
MTKWAFSDMVRDHFFNPKNLLENAEEVKADGVGTVGSPACGDIMRMYLWIKDNIVTDCKWQTFGCASAIASTSMLSEMIKGMTLEEAMEIRPRDIVENLGGLPDRKIHCSVLGDQALRAAIYDYYRNSGQTDKIPNDEIACGCKNLLKSDIQEAYATGANTFEEIQEKTGCATVCGRCEGKIRKMIDSFDVH